MQTCLKDISQAKPVLVHKNNEVIMGVNPRAGGGRWGLEWVAQGSNFPVNIVIRASLFGLVAYGIRSRSKGVDGGKYD